MCLCWSLHRTEARFKSQDQEDEGLWTVAHDLDPCSVGLPASLRESEHVCRWKVLVSRVLGTVSTEQREHAAVVQDVSRDKVGEPSFVTQETEL